MLAPPLTLAPLCGPGLPHNMEAGPETKTSERASHTIFRELASEVTQCCLCHAGSREGHRQYFFVDTWRGLLHNQSDEMSLAAHLPAVGRRWLRVSCLED